MNTKPNKDVITSGFEHHFQLSTALQKFHSQKDILVGKYDSIY